MTDTPSAGPRGIYWALAANFAVWTSLAAVVTLAVATEYFPTMLIASGVGWLWVALERILHTLTQIRDR